MCNGCDITVLDYSCLLVFDLIKLLILSVMHRELMTCLQIFPDTWRVYICFGGDFELPRIVNVFPNSSSTGFHLPSRAPQSMSWFSGLCRAGYLLKRLAMKAKFNLGFPRTTSVAVTNCRQPSLSACCNMHSALWMSSFSYNEKGCVKTGSELSIRKVDVASRKRNGHLTETLSVSLQMNT